MKLAFRGAGAVALALLLQACVSHPPPLPGHVYAGRLAVRSDAAPGVPARSMSGQFELSGNASSGQLILTSPIGTTVARARWSDPAGTQGAPSRIELEADGGTTRYATLEEMMQRAIGDQLPLPAMFDWLSGRPWPDAPARRSTDGGSFDQLGWHVDLSQLAGNQLIDAQRPLPAPALHVRVKLDAAEPAASAASAS
ncbi:MAG: lipoprotein insertase outer membrane protein LolB [Vitreoscilla sp.]